MKIELTPIKDYFDGCSCHVFEKGVTEIYEGNLYDQMNQVYITGLGFYPYKMFEELNKRIESK